MGYKEGNMNEQTSLFNSKNNTIDKDTVESKKCNINMCGRRKKMLKRVRPIDLYQGAAWNIIRKNRRKNTDVWVLSAKYGLINALTSVIDYYDELMTPERAVEILESDKDVWKKIIEKYDIISINTGGVYDLAIPKYVLQNPKVIKFSGSTLARYKKIKDFLMGRNQ